MNITRQIVIWVCTLGAALSLSIILFPALTLRILLLIYPKAHERRRELPAELHALPQRERFRWVGQQIETVLREGTSERMRARRHRRQAEKFAFVVTLTPLFVRVGVIAVSMSVSIALLGFVDTMLLNGPGITLPALLLLSVAALAALPQPRTVPPLVTALAETIPAAMVLGASGPSSAFFMIYLAVPFFIVARSQGLRASLFCSLAGALTLVAMASLAGQLIWADLSALAIPVACLFIGVPLMGSWMRWVTREADPGELSESVI